MRSSDAVVIGAGPKASAAAARLAAAGMRVTLLEARAVAGGGAGEVELAARGVQHRQVVVGFGQLGVVLHQPGVDLAGFLVAAGIAEGDALQEAQLRVARAGGQALFHPGQGGGALARAQQALDVSVLVGPGRRGGGQNQQPQRAGDQRMGHARRQGAPRAGCQGEGRVAAGHGGGGRPAASGALYWRGL